MSADKAAHSSVFRVMWIVMRTTMQLSPFAAGVCVFSALLAGFLNVRSSKVLQQIIDRLVSSSKTHVRNIDLPIATAPTVPISSSIASPSFPFQGVYNAAVADTTLVWLILTLAFASLSAYIFKSVAGRTSFYLGTRVEEHWRYRALLKIYELPLNYHDEHDGSVLNARLQRGGESIQRLVECLFGGSDLLVSLLTFVFALMTVLVQSPELWWVFIFPIPFYMGLSRLFGRQAKALQPKTDAYYDASHMALADGLAHVKMVKAYCREQEETDRHRDAWDNYHLMRVRQGMWYMFAGWARTCVDLLMRSLLLLSVAASQSVSARSISVGEVVQLLALQQLVLSPLASINATVYSAQRDAVSCSALFSIVFQSSHTDIHTCKELKPLQREISFHKVTFCYDTHSPPASSNGHMRRQRSDRSNTTPEALMEATKNRGLRIIKDLNLSIPAGITTALVGRSGSGKTTISWLASRFYDPETGSIYWDDTDLQEASWQSLRQQIGVVPQEVSLFNRTIRENIAYGCPDAKMEAIISAAKLAHAHDFIVKLPHGYNTVVGEQGRRLSGGQRQRVVVARALLINPSLLILDESSSQLDSECEEAIRDCIHARQSTGLYTTLVIAHRLSTVMRADQIICLDMGKITARGRHEELLKSNKTYQKWYRFQCLAEAEEGEATVATATSPHSSSLSSSSS